MLTKRFTLPLWLLTGILLAGCGSDLADSFAGKRVHFQIKRGEDRHERVFVQLGDNNQLTAVEGNEVMSLPYVINDDSLMIGPTEQDQALEIRFSNPVFSEGDQVTFTQHHLKNGDLQALLDSTDESTVKKPLPGTIVKIEAAKPVTRRVEQADDATEAKAVEDESEVASEATPQPSP